MPALTRQTTTSRLTGDRDDEFTPRPLHAELLSSDELPELMRDVLDGRIKDHIVGSLTSLSDDIRRLELLGVRGACSLR